MAVDPYPRTVDLSAAYNVRDVGGYRTRDGRTVRWRRLLRADSLHRLDGADAAAFAELGVRTVVDLRRPGEVQRYGRVPHRDGLDYRNIVIEHVDWDEVAYPAGTVHADWLAERYLDFTTDGRAGIAAALAVVADPAAAPVVVHCMAGKDRTGTVCALVLSLLGVTDEDIATDYALTSSAMEKLTAHLRVTAPDAVEGKEHMFEAPAEAMLLFLTELRRQHGSVRDYVRGIGVTDAQVASLHAHLLTES